ncbi:unnamed protein product [Parnassius apollo]|uniref:(apollo) hypothetical protein n=1 Tax=Parnassius apollo TaxID=110799 RepID=A0A8S3WLZ2_PARAO|nr:unnamed protein product [Parnassius apollo]
MEAENSDVEQPPPKRPRMNEQQQIFKNESDVDFSQDNLDFEGKFVVEDKYSNFVTPEELEKLREFKVLDEVKSNDEDSNNEESDSSEGKSEGVPEEEIERMLEENLPDNLKGAPKPKEKPYVTRQKIVLEDKGVNHFEVLPLDWMTVRHYSGMPVYMHRTTRVCTLSRPYFLGKGNTRRHDIPISAIPCLSYRRALEEEEKQKEIDRKIQEQIRNGTWMNNVSQGNDNSKTNSNNNETNQNTSPHVQEDTSSIVVSCEKNKVEIENMEQGEYETSGNKDKTQAIKVATSGVKINEENETNENSQNDDISMSTEEKSQQCCPYSHVAPSINIEEHNQPSCPFSQVDSTDNISNKEQNQLSCTFIQAVPEDNKSTEEKTQPSCPSSHTDPTDNTGTEEKTGPHDTESANNDQSPEGSKGTEDIPLNIQPVVLPGGIVMPPPRVESINNSWKTQHLTPEQINDYCKKLFKFKTVNIMHFNRWADRRKYTKARKTLQYPTLPEGTKLITIPAQPATGQENGGKAAKKDWVMNMNGRCYLSVFHEYVYRALQKQPVYEFKQLENAATPYQATVYIGGMQYGVGFGTSKRQAKSAAARASIHILIPEMKDQLEPTPEQNEPDFTFFDYLSIEDPRISEFCATTCEPSPHAILRTCLLRNFGAGDRHIHTEMKKLDYQKIELTMKVGKHSATVVCKNKKSAKQRASQSILQALHPHVRSWGSLLRLYGSRSVKSCKEKKLEEQQITLLQDKAQQNEPNYAVLEKLRHEMRKLRERDAAVVPIGTLLLSADLPPSASDLDHVHL